MALIRTERCETCKFRELDPKNKNPDGTPLFACHRFPPQQTHIGLAIPVYKEGKPLLDGNGQPVMRMEVRRLGDVPMVQGYSWCGEWRPFIEKAN